jgi:dipeptidyl aminopeptidase/acylaminoacyl peptidase
VHFLYLADSDVPEHHNLFLGSLHNSERTVLIPRASSNAVYANGYLFFNHHGLLMAQPFDVRTRTIDAQPVAIAEPVQQPPGHDHRTDFSVAGNGTLLYRSKQSPASWLDWRDRSGQRRSFISTPAEYSEPSFSPDEQRVALAVFDPKPSQRFGYGVNGVRGDIWLLDRETGAQSQFTSGPAADWGPLWSPDGRSIIFSSNRRGDLELFHRDASSDQDTADPLATRGSNPVAQSWSPDGRFVLYSAFDEKSRMDLWLLPMFGDRAAVPLLQSEFSEQQGQISPDGRWFAYTSDESGREEVYVRRFPKGDAKIRVSATGGGDPRWRRDGSELFYIAIDRQLMAVPVKAGTTFQYGDAVALFDTRMPPHWYEARNLYEVSKNGRFLFMTPLEDDRSTPFTIVLNPTKPSRD